MKSFNARTCPRRWVNNAEEILMNVLQLQTDVLSMPNALMFLVVMTVSVTWVLLEMVSFCQQEDECLTGNHDCKEVAKCNDLEGSYQCLCPVGYHGNGIECEDIDECTQEMDDCHHLAVCANTEGSYTCICMSDYTGNGTYCTDIDECVRDDKNHECSERDASCSNTPGSYMCLCQSGYQFGADGKCHDINECSEGDLESPGVCGEGGTCQNIEGSCLCACQPGYHTPESSTCSMCTAKNQVVRFEPEPEEARASQKIGAVILVCMTFVFLPIMISDVPSIVNALKDNQMIVRVWRRRYSRN